MAIAKPSKLLFPDHRWIGIFCIYIFLGYYMYFVRWYTNGF